TGDLVSRCFGHPVRLFRAEGRWSVRTGRTATAQRTD
ncbi:ABC transporter ATP-binding protein, partial [Streptomyces sp. SID3915]|nr:ABC transporter ATP-binding protein [Streptomyces sp. SID3915]